MSKPVRYQNRFVEPGYRGTPKTIFVTDRAEIKRWIQYFIDQRSRLRLDQELTRNQRKELAEAIEAFEWTPERTVLVKEPIE